MRVAILSMQRVANYGSFLQAYGLKKMIKSLGHDVEFVDYTIEPPIVQEGKPKRRTPIEFIIYFSKRVKHKLLSYTSVGKHEKQMFIDQQRVMHEFGKNNWQMLGISEPNYSPKLDALVIGSDEVFNCLQTSKAVGYSRELFGANNNADKLISYAASFGNTTSARLKNYGVADEVADYLKKFDSISVRDKNSINVIRELTGKEPYYHLDPVLISDYSSERVQSFGKKNYIIVYAYDRRISDSEKRIIKKLARKEGKKTVAIQGFQDFVDEFWPGNPFEVLEYFREADYIITDTFHGAIFSIINNKQFVALVRKTEGDSYGNEEKLTDLLDRLGLHDRIASAPCDIPKILKSPIDYDAVNKIRDNERKKTLEYLREYLGNE